MENRQERKLNAVLKGETFDCPPIWLMRQAGRYLPEYRALRKRSGSFLEMCYTPELAVEATLQPINRFGFDAAILFSDILVIPDAIGQAVAFEEGVGPILADFDVSLVRNFDMRSAMSRLGPVMEAVAGARAGLPPDTALLGFCGAPWTVATYMIAGHGTPDQSPARLFAHRRPEDFSRLIGLLADISAEYLVAQLKAGADAVQIFDSWAGVLGETDFEKWCVVPVRRMVENVRSVYPDARIIGFAKGAGPYLHDYRQRTGVDAVGLDWTVPMRLARQLQDDGPVQGLLDPTRLVAGGQALDEGIDAVLKGLGSGPLIFNLGHGITPDTPIAHVEQLIGRIRGRKGDV